MSFRLRTPALALVVLGSLAACGSDDDNARSSLQPVQPTSYVMVEPATTTTTLAPAQTTIPPEGATDPNEQTYTIQAGDSVSRIANLHGITMDQLIQWNQWTDGQSHLLIPGEQVSIPPNSKVPGTGSTTGSGAETGAGTSPSSDSTTTTAAEGGEGCMHTIVANDNPTRVAEKYGISVDVLQQANAGNPAWENFIPGDELIIPAGADC